MADVSSSLKDWSATASSNQPSGTTTVGTGLDDNLRQIQATIVQDLNSKGADIASAATTDLGAVAGFYHDITGVVTITGLGTVRAGVLKVIQFDGALTLTHNATSLILPGAANITTAAGDHALCMSLGSGNWVVMMYSRANGGPISYTFTTAITMSGKSVIEAEGAAVASAATTEIWATDGNTRHITGTTTITSLGTASQAGQWQKIIFDGALTLTHGANLNLPGSANITTAADDFAWVYADTTTQHDVLYFKKDGTAVVDGTTAATQANMEAATSNTVFVTPLNFKWSPHAAKVWAYWSTSGGTPSLQESINVSSLTDSGVGLITVNFSTAFAAATYCAASASAAFSHDAESRATGTVAVRTRAGDGSQQDVEAGVICFGDQ